MATSRSLFARLALIVLVWYLGLTFLPELLGTCLDGTCGFSAGEILLSVAMPVVFIALPIVLEMVLYQKTLAQALSDIGITRFSWTGIRSSVVYLLPLIVFYPLFSLATNAPIATQPNWQWHLLRILLVNGLAEEIMMRGFVFRHLREGRSFWRAAVLATVYFAAYHVGVIFTAGAVVGIIAIITAVPLGLLTAYIYERGNNTVWGPGLLHFVYNAFALVFIFPADLQPIAASLYLLTGIVVSSIMLVWAYRGNYGRVSDYKVETAN